MIDTVGLYVARAAILATWPVENFLTLRGHCHRDLTTLRAVVAEILDRAQPVRQRTAESEGDQGGPTTAHSRCRFGRLAAFGLAPG